MFKFIILCSFLAAASASVSTPYLVNATETLGGQYNFIAQITIIKNTGAKFIDTAVLINNRHLLTKASSLVDAASVTVVLGALFPDQPEIGQQKFTVPASGIIFPEKTTWDYPAIIVLPKPARITKRVQPVLLPRWRDIGKNYDGSTGTVVAWKTIEGRRRRAAYRNVVIQENRQCNVQTTKEYLCVADSVADGGDIGAPIVMRTKNGIGSPLTVVGLFSYVSHFQKDGATVQTNVFLKLNEHLKFISEKTGVFIRP